MLLPPCLVSLGAALRIRRRHDAASASATDPPRRTRKMTLHLPSLFKLSLASSSAPGTGTTSPTDHSDIDDPAANRPYASAPEATPALADPSGARPALAPRDVVLDGSAPAPKEHEGADGRDGKGFLFGNGSPALMGLFRALADGNDDGSSSEEETGETSRRPSGEATDRGHASVPASRSDGGEWIGPIETVSPSTSGVASDDPTRTRAIDGEPAASTASDRRVVIPPFYRKASVNQADLSHRLAVLSVNNYSRTEDADAGADADAGIDGLAGTAGRSRSRATSGISAREPISVSIPGSGLGAQRDKRELVEERAHEISAHLHDDAAPAIEQKLRRDVEDKTGAPATVPGRQARASPGVTSELIAEPYRSESPQRMHLDLPNEIGASAPPTADTTALSPEEKLAAIIEEFGEISPLMLDSPPERFVAESYGSLFRGVLVVGVIHLTTHRLTFHAVLPPPMSIQNENGYTDGHTTVIHSGPITMRRQHNVAFSRRSRVWLELTGEMLTTYPSADEAGRVRPIRSILLGTIKRLYPLDPEHPCDIRLQYSMGHQHGEAQFTVDTRESALEWHRQLEAALFEHDRGQRYQILLAKRAKQRQLGLERGEALDADAPTLFGEDGKGWEMLRICIPLDRVVDAMCEDYLQIARIIALEVDLTDPEGRTDDYLQCARDTEMLFPANDWPGRKITPPVLPAPPKRSSTIASKFSLGAMHRHSSASGTPVASENQEVIRQSPAQRQPLSARLNTCNSVNPHDDMIAEGSEPAANEQTPVVPKATLPTSGTVTADRHPATSTQTADSAAPSTGSFRFGVLNHRVSFAHSFKETMHAVREEKEKRAYRPDIHPPLPVIDIGQFSFTELSAAENKNTVEAPIEFKQRKETPAPKRVKHGFHFFGNLKSAEEADDGEYASTDEEGPLAHSNPRRRGKRNEHKQRKMAAARAVFGLETHESIWIKRCYISRHIPLRGHIVLTDKYLCYWRKTLSEDTDIKVSHSWKADEATLD